MFVFESGGNTMMGTAGPVYSTAAKHSVLVLNCLTETGNEGLIPESYSVLTTFPLTLTTSLKASTTMSV